MPIALKPFFGLGKRTLRQQMSWFGHSRQRQQKFERRIKRTGRTTSTIA